MDHLQMPELIASDYTVYMNELERRQYENLTQEMTLSLNGGEVTAKNAMALGTKLIRMSNGLVYGTDGTPITIHSRKIEALEDLIEAANSKPVLVVYSYRHDLTRISAMLRDAGDHCRRRNIRVCCACVTSTGLTDVKWHRRCGWEKIIHL